MIMEVERLSYCHTPILLLPNEVLAHVFSFCSKQDLGRLSVTCKRFRNIVNNDSVWKKISMNIVISNQVSSKMKERCIYEFCAKDKVRISYLWFHSSTTALNQAIRFKKRFIPQVHIERTHLWFTKGNALMWRMRAKNGVVKRVGGGLHTHFDDITSFVLLPNFIVTGGRDNQIFVFSKESKEKLCQVESAHSTEVACLDCNNEFLVSVGRNTEVKIYKNLPNLELRYSFFHGDHIWTTAIMETRKILIGSASWRRDVHPLQLLDVERNTKICELGSYPRHGAGISCICPESTNEVYTGSYDTAVRLWDVRTPTSSVRSWDDPFDSSIVSLSSDYRNTIFAGTQRHGFVCLCDKRTNGILNFYYMGDGNSPVYSITFDALYLITALDRGIYLRSCGHY